MSDMSDMSMERGVMRSGWPTFAGVVALIIGAYNILSGIAALAEDDQTEKFNEVLFGVDISAWGWFWLILGVLQVGTGVLILLRNPIGQVAGVTIAAISATMTVFLIFVYPLWALTVLLVDMLVIYGLLAHADEFE